MGIFALVVLVFGLLATRADVGFAYENCSETRMMPRDAVSLPNLSEQAELDPISQIPHTESAESINSDFSLADDIALWDDVYFQDIFDALEHLYVQLHKAALCDNIYGVLRQLTSIQQVGNKLNSVYRNFCRVVVGSQKSSASYNYMLKLLRRNYRMIRIMSLEINSFFDSPVLKSIYHEEKMDWAEPFVVFDVLVFDNLCALYRQLSHMCDETDFIIVSQQHEEIMRARNKSPAREFTFDDISLI